MISAVIDVDLLLVGEEITVDLDLAARNSLGPNPIPTSKSNNNRPILNTAQSIDWIWERVNVNEHVQTTNLYRHVNPTSGGLNKDLPLTTELSSF